MGASNEKTHSKSTVPRKHPPPTQAMVSASARQVAGKQTTLAGSVSNHHETANEKIALKKEGAPAMAIVNASEEKVAVKQTTSTGNVSLSYDSEKNKDSGIDQKDEVSDPKNSKKSRKSKKQKKDLCVREDCQLEIEIYRGKLEG